MSSCSIDSRKPIYMEKTSYKYKKPHKHANSNTQSRKEPKVRSSPRRRPWEGLLELPILRPMTLGG